MQLSVKQVIEVCCPTSVPASPPARDDDQQAATEQQATWQEEGCGAVRERRYTIVHQRPVFVK
jgi:hypothetical protein